MATIADLNVRLGVINNVAKGLAKAERDWRRAGEKMAGIGQQISLSIGLPLGLIGRQAIKAAGDIESMTFALEAQLGSAQAAREEIEKLRTSALAPGLGFEQAVKGSIQLQAVGFSADRARKTIEAFGNGLALAGKGAQELDGVLLALTQISAKGVISAEEINQIAERLPQIRTLMKQAFGTANTEALQKLGVTSDQFIDAITQQLQKLPKATGGIKNAFDNLRDSINQSLASIGTTVNETFNLAAIFERAGKALSGAAKAFDDLSDGGKKFVIVLAGALTAIGPLLVGIGSLKVVGSLAAGGLLVITNGLKALIANALLAARAFQALSLAQKAFGVGAVLFLVYSLVTAFADYNDQLKSTTAAQRALNDVNETAEESIAGQRVEVERLTKTIEKEGTTLAQKQKALDALVKISPEYYGQLDRTAISVDKVRAATDRYVASLRLEAKIKAAKDELVEYEKQLLRVEKNSDAGILQQFGNAILSVGNAGAFAARNALTYTENLAENRKELGDSISALEKYIAELEVGNDVAGKIEETKPPGPSVEAVTAATDAINKDSEALKKALKLRKDYADAIKGLAVNAPDGPAPDIAAQPDLARVGSQALGGLAAPIQQTAEEVEKANQIAKDFASTFENVGFSIAGTLAQVTNGTITASDALQKLYEGLRTGSASAQAQIETLQSGLIEVIANIGSAIGEGASSFAEFAASATNSIAQVISALLKEWVAQLLVNSAFAAANPFAAIAIGAAAASIGAGLFKRIIGSLTAPKLAQGGLAFGPTTAIVGDNPGARANPEVIAPLDKLKQYLRPQAADGAIVGEYVVRGQDLLVVLKRAETSNQRLTGKR